MSGADARPSSHRTSNTACSSAPPGIGTFRFTVRNATTQVVESQSGISLVVWWPGIHRWRRSAFVEFRGTWKQVNWNLHRAFGIWFIDFILMWEISGLYLSIPQPFSAAADYIEPFDDANPDRFVDHVLF